MLFANWSRPPVIGQCQQGQTKAAKRARQSRHGAVEMKRVANQENTGAERCGNSVNLAAFEDFGSASAEHVAQRASAGGSDNSQQQRGKTPQAGVDGARAAGNGKETESGGVNKGNRAVGVFAGPAGK